MSPFEVSIISLLVLLIIELWLVRKDIRKLVKTDTKHTEELIKSEAIEVESAKAVLDISEAESRITPEIKEIEDDVDLDVLRNLRK